MAEVITRGRLKLQPVDGSIDKSALDIEIDLVRSDGVLTVGDLRKAAEIYGMHGHHEVAHRLWAAAGQAVAELDDSSVAKRMQDRAESNLSFAGNEVSENFRRSGVKHDYQKIAGERGSGISASDVALTNNCSTSTVSRAVEFVETWDQLQLDHPDFAERLSPAANPEELADHYDIDVNVMRWIVAISFDRRDPESSGQNSSGKASADAGGSADSNVAGEPMPERRVIYSS